MKNTHFFGQTIFSQLFSLIDKNNVSKVVSKNLSDRYYKNFDTWQHLVKMLYCSFIVATSLKSCPRAFWPSRTDSFLSEKKPPVGPPTRTGASYSKEKRSGSSICHFSRSTKGFYLKAGSREK